jgi:hypothetical protein
MRPSPLSGVLPAGSFRARVVCCEEEESLGRDFAREIGD